MAKIIVCYKWVKVEEDIRINPDLSVDLSKAKGKISDYDRNAIETAKRISGSTSNDAVGLTFGVDAKASSKDALARGLKQVFWVTDKLATNADGLVTANVLAAAINQIGDYKLIICAEGAVDTYAHQVGPRIGALLDIPVISCVKELTVEGNKLVATRKLENCTEIVECELPAVVTVLPEINEAPLPGLKSVLDAGKKPNTELKIADLGLTEDDLTRKTEVKSFKGYVMVRKNIIFSEGDAAAKVNALAASLKKEGVL